MSLPPSGSYTTGDLRGPTHAPRLSPTAGLTVTYSIGAEAANVIRVTTTVKNVDGTVVDYPVVLQQYLSSDSAGATPSAATTSLAAGGGGAILTEYTSNMHWDAVSTSAGLIGVDVGDSVGASTRYLNTVLPNGRVVTSSAITFV